MRHHQRRPIDAGDALRDREGLARPGYAEQHLRLVATVQPIDELVDSPRLVAAQLEVSDQSELVVLG